jgi:hypothetical protein
LDSWVIYREEKRHTLGGAKTHSTKLLKVGIRKRKKIMNYIAACKRQSSILNLQATNFTFPHAFDPQKKNWHHNWIECLQQLKEACEHMKN